MTTRLRNWCVYLACLGAALLNLFTPGCVTSSCSSPSVGAPASAVRIEYVVRLGAFIGCRAAIAKGHRPEVERALAGLETLQAQESIDLVAVWAALGAAGVDQLASDEGSLILDGALIFTDLWSGAVAPITDDVRARAVLSGLVRGVRLALSEPVARGPTDPAEARLRQEAVAHRR